MAMGDLSRGIKGIVMVMVIGSRRYLLSLGTDLLGYLFRYWV